MRFGRRPSLEQQAIQAVSVLTTYPGDRIVVTCAYRLTQEQGAEIARHVAEFAGVEADRVLVVINTTISVLRHGAPPPPPVYIAPAKEARGI